ncbi:BnaC09g08960D [Brassica napus]|uniref:BnaC09g08960D protein n=1 Tax=Brassica napus TaxID=3708 RepID=A0A078GND9_BRANA|nr:BnaC09g08960D [Brassica napus]
MQKLFIRSGLESVTQIRL